jgi:hypothetical protein
MDQDATGSGSPVNIGLSPPTSTTQLILTVLAKGLEIYAMLHGEGTHARAVLDDAIAALRRPPAAVSR